MKMNNLKKLVIVFLTFLMPTITNASIPVTYTCCHDYLYSNGIQLDSFDGEDLPNNGIQLDNFENLGNWTIVQGSQRADITNFIEGTQGLELIATNGNRAYTDKIINNNFSNTKNFAIWIYVYNSSSFEVPVIYFTSTGPSWSKYFSKFYYDSPLSAGWNELVFDKNSFDNTNGESWDNVMNRIRIAIYPISNQSTNATLDNLRFDMSGNWTVGGIGASQRADTINFKEGSQGLKLIATNGSSAFTDSAISANFSDTNNFVVWTYIENASNLTFVRLYLTSTGKNWNKYFYDDVWKNGFETGWNKLVFNKNNFENDGGESWNNIMNRMRLRIGPTGTANINVTFDDIRDNMIGQRAKLMIEFDDGDNSTYTNAYPILKANNQTAISFVVTSYIGNPDIMNLDNLRTLQNAGWDISSHTVDHYDLTSLDGVLLTTELNDSYNWLVSNRFQKSAGFISYPYGTFNDLVIDKVKKRYIFGRSTSPDTEFQHFTPDDSIRYIQRTINVYNGTTVQTIENQLNNIINAKLLGILLFHDISNYPDIYSYPITDFQTISNYIKSRSVDIDVVTYNDYVISNINSFTPVINKTTRIYSNGSATLITNNMYDEYMPNMTIVPLSGSIDIGITDYNETSGHVRFNESANSNVNYNIGDRIPNQSYSIKIYWSNGTLYQNFNIIANNTGYISYSSPGFGYSRYQDITFVQPIDTAFTVTLPIGYTFLRFNASNSTVTNLNPDGQNSFRPIFNIVNNGNINQSFMLHLNNIVNSITAYADLSNNFSKGKVEINTSNTTIVPNLIPGQSQNIWIIIDTKKAPATNINRTLIINSNNS